MKEKIRGCKKTTIVSLLPFVGFLGVKPGEAPKGWTVEEIKR